MTASQYKNRIIELEKNKDFRGAYDLLKDAISEYPANPFFIKGEIYVLFKLGRLEEARQNAEVRIEQFKQDTFFLRTYLNILAGLKNTKKDIEELIDKILSWGIRDEDFLISLIRSTNKVLGSNKASDVLKRSLSLMPESEALKKMLDEAQKDGMIDSRFSLYKKKFEGKGIEEAINEIEMIMEMPDYSDNYELNLYLAGLYKESGRLEKAVEIYKKLLAIRDNEFARKMLGYTYYKIGDMANALVYMGDIFLKNPFDHYLYTTIFKIYGGLKDYVGLESLSRKALMLNPDAKHLYGLIKKAEKWQKK